MGSSEPLSPASRIAELKAKPRPVLSVNVWVDLFVERHRVIPAYDGAWSIPVRGVGGRDIETPQRDRHIFCVHECLFRFSGCRPESKTVEYGLGTV